MNGRLCLLWTKQDFVDYYADAETCAPVSWYFHNMRTRFDTIYWAPGDAAPKGSFAPPAYCLGRAIATLPSRAWRGIKPARKYAVT